MPLSIRVWHISGMGPAESRSGRFASGILFGFGGITYAINNQQLQQFLFKFFLFFLNKQIYN